MKKKRKESIPEKILNSYNGQFQFFVRFDNKEFIIQREVMELIEKLSLPTKEDNSIGTKQKKIINHLIKYKSITSWEAIKKYRATRLSAIIFNLKKKGFVFKTIIEKNNKAYYARYHYLYQKNK